MIDIHNFEEIRPYADNEVNDVVNGIAQLDFFTPLTTKIFPDQNQDTIREIFCNNHSIKEFQQNVIYPVLKKIISESSKGISQLGFDRLNKNTAYLFISNHHDIILDPSILNMALHERELDTTEVAIGDNLMQTKWIRDLAKLNKSFIVNRTPSLKQAYYISNRLSNYIKYTIHDRNRSVWIAQREGRAKDGNDVTQVSLLKMLAFGGDTDKCEYLKTLNILPVSMSYEYDPCDILKVKESIEKENNKAYSKKKDDDLKSMVTGLTGYKGRINITLGNLLDKEFDDIILHDSAKDRFSSLAATIDEQIQSSIKLWPTNFIAYDILMNDQKYSDQYTQEEKEHFIENYEKKIESAGLENTDAKIRMLSIYANPLKNKIRLTGFNT